MRDVPTGGVGCVAFPVLPNLKEFWKVSQRQPCCKNVGNSCFSNNSWSNAQNAPTQKKVSRHTTISNLSNGCCSPTHKFANVLFPIACDCRSGLRYFIRKGILNKYFEILVDYTFLHEKTCTRRFRLKQKSYFTLKTRVLTFVFPAFAGNLLTQ